MTKDAPGSDEKRWRHWPYPTKSMLDAPDRVRIELHAEAMLSRALNIGRVVAFVGAGVSMSYGRMSWGGLVYRLQEKALKKAVDYGQHINDPAWSRVRQAIGALKKLKIEENEEISNENLPIIVEFSDLIDKEIRAVTGETPDSDENPNFRRLVEIFTRNDSGQAESILTDAFTYDTDVKTSEYRERYDEAMMQCWGMKRTPTDRLAREFRRLFTGKILGKIAAGILDEPATDFANEYIVPLAKKCQNYDRTDRSNWLLPTHRFLLGALLTAVRPDRRKVILDTAASTSPIQSTDASPPGEPAAPNSTEAVIVHPKRQEFVPPARDPLLIMIRSLSINRFLTTNYDAEIERALFDLGYRLEGGPKWRAGRTQDQNEAVAPLAQDASAIVFDSARSGDLVSVAVEDRERHATIVHLHGRAGDEDGIIITESDYQKRYMRVDDRRPLIDEAISLSFGANPILFVGSGMTEDDILRPLRHFASSHGRMHDRLGIALLPATLSEKDLLIRTVKLLQRYGIYTIHYGKASFCQTENGNKEVNWLQVFTEIRKKIDSVLKLIEKSTNTNDRIAPVESEISVRFITDVKDILTYLKAEEKPPRKICDGNGRLRLPAYIEGTKHGQSVGVDHENLSLVVEIGIVNAAIEFLELIQATSPDPAALQPLRLAARAYQVALSGVADSVLGVFLCARLNRARNDWDLWRSEWMELPTPLSPSGSADDAIAFQLGVLREGNRKIVKLTRQRLDLPARPITNGADDCRFYRDSPSQTFNAFRAALESNYNLVNAGMGRRIVLLVSPRGAGKGHFLNSLEPPEAPNEYSRLRELLLQLGGNAGVRWAGAAFLKLGLSHEVASVFDRLALFLVEQAKSFWKDAAVKINEARLESDRVEYLKFILEVLGDTGEKKLGEEIRVMIVLSGIGILFEKDGLPKNAQIRRLFEAIFSETAKRAPVDFLFITEASTVPCWFREAATAPESETSKDKSGRGYQGRLSLGADLTVLTEPDMSATRYFKLAAQMRAAQMAVPPPRPASAGIRAKPLSNRTVVPRDPVTLVHHFHEARCSVLLTAFFPDLAIMLAVLSLVEMLDRSAVSTAAETWKRLKLPQLLSPEWVQKAQDAVRKALGPVTGRRVEGRRAPMHRADLTYPMFLTAAADACCQGQSDALAIAIAAFDAASKVAEPPDDSAPLERTDQELTDQGKVAAGLFVDTDRRALLIGASNLLDERFGRLFKAVDRGRFGLTLVASTAIALARDAGSDTNVRRGMEAADRFLREIEEDLTALDEGQRDNLAIGRCLEKIERLYEPAASKTEPRCSLDLLQTILWHLAVIGQPVEIAVLARCPLILKACRGRSGATQICELVARHVGELHRLCLVFKVEPLPDSRDNNEELMKCRYAVHSLVQRNIFQRLGAPLIEFPHADQFTVTIYAAQPNDLPRLSLKVHQDLGRTVAALSGYDNDQGDGEDYNLLIKQDIGNKYLQQRMLRAAFALLRSIYSLPVIARFQVPPDDGTSKGEPVAASPRFLEEHRRLIRWVLRQAVKLENGDASQQQVKPGSGERSEQTCALHKEEIVWLFNEAGVLSLVQGRLHDARALFDRALAAADRIERNEHGALHTRILLNRALVDIERGRAGRTIGTLRRIAGSKDVEHPVLPLLAAGYLGLVHHFNGDVKAAMDRYEEVIGPLQQHRQYRSASIFVRHMADLLRVADNPDFVKSRTCVEQAIRFAMDGGHEDMRHQGLLSSARIDIAEIEAGSKRAVAASAVQAKLVVVERYARTIDIPRMLCDVAHFRALLHCHGGNLTTAGLLVSDALEIAARNGLRVKKIALLILLARINAERGYAAISLPLLNHAVRIAQSAKCHFELGRAQNLINELSLGGHRIKIAG